MIVVLPETSSLVNIHRVYLFTLQKLKQKVINHMSSTQSELANCQNAKNACSVIHVAVERGLRLLTASI